VPLWTGANDDSGVKPKTQSCLESTPSESPACPRFPRCYASTTAGVTMAPFMSVGPMPDGTPAYTRGAIMRCSTLLMISLALHLSCLLYDARSRRHRLLAAFNSLWASVDRRKLTVQLENGCPSGQSRSTPSSKSTFRRDACVTPR
jgi:hypothetical protein